jgi:predicted CoA-binding protein
MDTWRANLLTTSDEIRGLLAQARRVAVLGMRSERNPGMPSFYVPAALAAAGLEIVPVPVYEQSLTHMLDRPVYRKLVDIPGPIDIVDVFRRPEDLPGHVDDLLAKKPGAVWFQSGIREDTVAETLARAGIKVVQSRCLMVDYQGFKRS